MAIYQSYNKRINAWVKYKLSGNKSTILDVKQRNSKVAFKGVKKK